MVTLDFWPIATNVQARNGPFSQQPPWKNVDRLLDLRLRCGRHEDTDGQQGADGRGMHQVSQKCDFQHLLFWCVDSHFWFTFVIWFVVFVVLGPQILSLRISIRETFKACDILHDLKNTH